MGTTTPTHRVVCGDFVHETRSLPAALTFITNVEASRACLDVHTVQVRDGDDWAPLHEVRARTIMSAPMLTTVDTLDGPMVKVAGSWSVETAERAEAAVDPAVDPVAWRQAIGPHEQATVTADGQAVQVDDWCTCPIGGTSLGWVRFERWTTAGRVSHGYVCPGCRRITQTG